MGSRCAPAMEMWVSLDRALELACGRALPTPSAEVVPLDAALGRRLSADVVSRIDDPAFTNSSMDGFALRVEDAADASAEAPVVMPVVQEIVAGASTDLPALAGCSVARIMTGAPLPPGADSILPIEATEPAEAPEVPQAEVPAGTIGWVRLLAPPKPHFVRQRGENLVAGQAALVAGERLDAARVGLAATMGHAEVAVQRPYHVAVVSTGDELCPPGGEPAAGQIFESNSYAMAAQARSQGHAASRHHAVDTDAAVRELLDSLAETADVIVTSGGASVGDHDVMRRLLTEEGEPLFWRLRIRPGNPVMFAHWKGTPLFALPGNPVSSLLVFRLLVQPWLAFGAGEFTEVPRAGQGEQRARVRLVDAVKGTKDKLTMRRVHVSDGADGVLEATVKTHQGSGNLHSLVAGNAVTLLEPGQWGEPGDVVDALLL